MKKLNSNVSFLCAKFIFSFHFLMIMILMLILQLRSIAIKSNFAAMLYLLCDLMHTMMSYIGACDLMHTMMS